MIYRPRGVVLKIENDDGVIEERYLNDIVKTETFNGVTSFYGMTINGCLFLQFAIEYSKIVEISIDD